MRIHIGSTEFLETHPETLRMITRELPAKTGLRLIECLVRDENRLKALP